METRETLKEKGWNDEQITTYLNMAHSVDEERKALNSQKASMEEAMKKEKEENANLQKQIDDYNKAKMSDEEKTKANLKASEDKLKEASIIVNKAKAKEILAGYGVDDLIDTLVSADEKSTLDNANAFKQHLDAIKENTIKETKESITKIDVTPNVSNVTQAEANGDVTKDAFEKMSITDQIAFKRENPDKYNELYS